MKAQMVREGAHTWTF